jgi:SAM-dependent methyltransferase
VHVALLVAAVAVLPVRIIPGWVPADHGPIPWLLGVLALSIGLPFFMVSTTAPLLQQWFAQTDHPEARDPYFLYQASNLGSMTALVAYPAILEPWLGLRSQGIAWTAAYGVFAVLCAICGAQLVRSPSRPLPPSSPSRRDRTRSPSLTWRRVLRWIGLAAVPSSLLLGVTTYISTDVAVVPLLWVVPLALYLLTFVAAFARRPWISERYLVAAMPLVSLPLLVVIIQRAAEPAWLIIPLHLAAFAVAALVCHQQLAGDRPDATHLTVFYLCLSAGGALGGLFNALVAPVLFPVPLEYPLALIAASLFKPYRDVSRAKAHPNAGDFVWPVLLGIVTAGLFLLVGRGGTGLARMEIPIAFGVPLLACLMFSPRPVRLALGMAALLAASSVGPDPFGKVIHVARSFFGVHRVVENPADRLRLLFHGNTLHGVQSLDPARALEPEAYYTRSGPAGQVFAALPDRHARDVAVVGLGAGALASFARPGDRFTFYEIDPEVVRMARDEGYFSYLQRSPGTMQVVIGDARLSLRWAVAGQYDLIVLDAFSSDAVPVHLLTREALALYLAKLKPGGMLAFHSSSRFLRLRREFRALALDAHLVHARQLDLRSERRDHWSGWTPSEWIVMARKAVDLGRLALDARWTPIPDSPAQVWTDDYSNLIGIFRWR